MVCYSTLKNDTNKSKLVAELMKTDRDTAEEDWSLQKIYEHMEKDWMMVTFDIDHPRSAWPPPLLTFDP